MSSTPELQVSDFVPREAIQRALTGTTEVCQIPPAWRGKYVYVVNGDPAAELHLNFGPDASITIDAATATTRDGSAPHALTISPATPKLTVPGADIRFRLDPAWTHFAHQSTGTGIMRMVLATGTGR